MILVDSGIWIGHLRAADAGLAGLLVSNVVLVHPFVVGEIALARLRNRAEVLAELRRLPVAPVAADDEVAAFIDSERLHGEGIGYVGAHLLASARLAADCVIWTRDARLLALAERLSLAVRGMN